MQNHQQRRAQKLQHILQEILNLPNPTLNSLRCLDNTLQEMYKSQFQIVLQNCHYNSSPNKQKENMLKILDRCSDRTVELIEVFQMLLKVLGKGNQGLLVKCLQQLKTIISEIQESICTYESEDQSIKEKVQFLKTAFMTEVSSSIDNNKGKNKSISTVSSPTHKTKTELMESIKIETKNINIKTKSQYIEEDQKIISDLEDEIQSLNQALSQNNRHYVQKIKTYSEQIVLLQEEIHQFNSEIHYMKKKENSYLEQIQVLKNENIENSILLKNMFKRLQKASMQDKYIKTSPYFHRYSATNNHPKNSRSSSKYDQQFRMPSSIKRFNRLSTDYY